MALDKIAKLFPILSGLVDVGAQRDTLPDIGTVANVKDISTLAKRIESLDSNTITAALDGISGYTKSVIDDVSSKATNNAKIIALLPEVRKAISIMIPSIMSPNDLRGSANISIISTCQDLTPDANTQIAKLITSYIEDQMHLETNLPMWIKDALYKDGAKAILILPIDEVNTHLNGNIVSATESIELLCKHDELFKQNRIDASTIVPAIEEAIQPYDIKIPGHNYGKCICAVEDSLSITSSIETLGVVYALEEQTKKKINKVKTKYTNADVIAINSTQKKKSGAVHIELPVDSIIPLHTPNKPHEHIGYFIAIDETGNPIRNTGKSEKSKYENLEAMFGITKKAPDSAEIMSNIHSKIVIGYLEEKLSSAGLHGLSVSESQSVYKCIFSRYLANRKTKFVFVPKELMMYLAYDYRENGTGASKLEDAEFIISIRIMLLLCNLMSSMNNAIDRQLVEVTLPDKFKGDTIGHLTTIRKALIAKSSMTISADPTRILETLTDKGISMRVTGAPEGYSVTRTANERTAQTIDTNLIDDVRNTLGLALDIPPSALNRLDENEYSSSVATTNLFFSLTIRALQAVTILHVSKLIQTFIAYDDTIMKKLLEYTNHSECVIGEPNADELLQRTLKGIKLYLPAPNVAPDKATFDNMSAHLSGISALVEGLAPDELVTGDTDLADYMTRLRGVMKSHSIYKYLADNGLSSLGVTTPENLDITKFTNIIQHLTNIKSGVDKLKSLHTEMQTEQPPTI
jgi:hypothetical protein